MRIRSGSRRAGVVGLSAAAGLAALGGLSALGSAPAGAAVASSKVTVVKATETDFHIALSKVTWKPGKYKFVATNKGQVTHSLQITGPGLGSDDAASQISPGQSTTLTVTLKKGKYDLFCPIPGHKMLGMNVNITVGGSGGSSSGGGAHTTTTTHASGGGYGY